MSRIVDSILAEQQAAARKHEATAAQIRKQEAARLAKWVKDEAPRAAKFHTKINKMFPSLKGDFTVGPRERVGDLEGSFTAVVDVDGCDLEIRIENDVPSLFVPYQYTNGSGWQTRWYSHEVRTDSELRERVKKFINDRAFEHAQAEKYWDSLPIGNTD